MRLDLQTFGIKFIGTLVNSLKNHKQTHGKHRFKTKKKKNEERADTDAVHIEEEKDQPRIAN